ncbi:hypothetical protein [Paenibacillus tarimensis]|uniref:hypothetical protein n=1 Tax=Paenibacillus tarimensis TaxID=416012 RepID=UPI001F27D18B|nr:hypothetical protein [Paenibacillus tarimensis]MCF2942809.1 hypothetical protein [Paenibacillus tarimensis]
MASSNQVKNTVENIAKKLHEKDVQYVFAGSVSSFLQGCEIIPGDIDLLVPEAGDVHKITVALSAFVHDNTSSLEEDIPIEEWFSTAASPVKTFTDFADNEWTFARLAADGIKLEAANIRPVTLTEYIHGSGFWENGPHVWEHVKRVPYNGLSLPVIPLEIQLETNMNRGLESRIREICRIFRTAGYDKALINYALSKGNIDRFYTNLNTSD